MIAVPSRLRWTLLAVALASTLAAARLIGREDGDAPAPSARAGAPAATDTRAAAPALELDRLATRSGGAPAGDPFHTISWQSLAQQDAARRDAPPPPPPPPPSAPPLPFAYMGKLVDDGRIVIFLTDGDNSYAVREGDTIDQTYRVDAVTEESVSVTYLPLRQKQRLVFGGDQ
jgi:hypothetical protein